jgi:endonuclease/exonuclease/phosphatase family metal-dependent hydrolase
VKLECVALFLTWSQPRGSSRGSGSDRRGGSPVFVNTHLQSSIEEDLVRRAQLIQLRRFVARLFDRFDPARHAVIAVGDFNVVGETEEYQRMLGHLTYPRDAYRARNGDPGSPGTARRTRT